MFKQFVSLATPFVSAFMGAFAANWLTTQREQRAETKEILKRIVKAAHDHKQALEWQFGASQFQYEISVGIVQLAPATAQESRQSATVRFREANAKRTDTSTSLLYLELDLKVHLGEEKSKRLLDALEPFRQLGINPAEQLTAAWTTISDHHKMVLDRVTDLLKDQRMRSSFGIARTASTWIRKKWATFENATTLPPY